MPDTILARAAVLAALLGMLLAVQARPQETEAAAAPADRAPEVIARHQLLRAIYAFHFDTRALYHDQTFVLLYLHGGRTERIGSYDTPSRMLDAAVEARAALQTARFGARLDRLDGVTEAQRAELARAVTEMETAIETSYAMADRLRADDLDAATALFHDRALPAFRQAWKSLHTVTSDLERSMPIR